MSEPVELVAKFQPEGEPGWIACRMDDAAGWEFLQSEIAAWTDERYGTPGEVVGTVTFEYQPEGWAAALPEFEGW